MRMSSVLHVSCLRFEVPLYGGWVAPNNFFCLHEVSYPMPQPRLLDHLLYTLLLHLPPPFTARPRMRKVFKDTEGGLCSSPTSYLVWRSDFRLCVHFTTFLSRLCLFFLDHEPLLALSHYGS